MYQYIFIGILVLGFASCQNQQHKVSDEIAENDIKPISVPGIEEINYESNEPAEFFSDESKIGSPRKNKIEISEFRKFAGNFATIKFYSSGKNKDWKLKQTFEFEKNTFLGCDPQLEDFNNDGLKDLTCISMAAARGANEVRRLFIYDKNRDELIYIKNSEDYPNLQYNKELNCLDALHFYGGVSTTFLKIDGDRLKQFASVEHFGDERTVSAIDENGEERILRKDKISRDDFYERYKNFNPPTPYR